MTRVLFICHGNICRSPMAEFIMKDMVKKRGLEDKFYISSAATSRDDLGCDMHHGAKRKLNEMGIPFSRRSARQITKKDYSDFDLLLVMDRFNVSDTGKITGGDPDGKIIPLLSFAGMDRDIADPWYTGDFDATYDDIVTGLTAYFEKHVTV